MRVKDISHDSSTVEAITPQSTESSKNKRSKKYKRTGNGQGPPIKLQKTIFSYPCRSNFTPHTLVQSMILSRYLERFYMTPNLDRKEIKHWLLYKESGIGERVVFAYVNNRSITDFFSFYALGFSVIGGKEHEFIRAAYLFYYASEIAPKESLDMKKEPKIRLNTRISDLLILAKKLNFNVFNALTLLNNTLFLQEQKISARDRQLHYYLFNWQATYIGDGIDAKGNIDKKSGSGVGVVML